MLKYRMKVMFIIALFIYYNKMSKVNYNNMAKKTHNIVLQCDIIR